MYQPHEIFEFTAAMGEKKIKKSIVSKSVLGFIGGAMISLGYLAYIRISAGFTGSLAGLGNLLGAAVFPIGLIVILLAGGELVTGNMMAVSAALFERKISIFDWIKNLLTITFANAIGALFVAFVFGHIVGLTANGIYAEHLISVASHKTEATFLQAFFSGIGCNWFVGLSLWLCYGTKDDTAKILSIWFPVMTFVAIGFQHSVANLFLLPAAMLEGYGTLSLLLQNVIPVFFGNIIGGGIFVSFFYFLSYKKYH